MDNADFYNFCRQATDEQLEEIAQKEFEAGRQVDYLTAKVVAAERGWTIWRGRRR
jgi:hypothetical protein